MTVGWLLLEMNLADWFLVFLATAIIWKILGERLKADIQRWRTEGLGRHEALEPEE